MKKFVTILLLLFVAPITYSAVDPSIQNTDTCKTTVDSSKIKVKKAINDSSVIKAKIDTISSKPDSVQKFVDKNGDGFNDNAPDHDGDGIPDALDKDYWALKEKEQPKPQDGAPPGVLGLDRTPGKILPNDKSKREKKPGIKFNIRSKGGKR